MKQVLSNHYFKYGALALILLFAAAQFILILRHKSPYTSDSYFYKQIFYQLKGDSFQESRKKILQEVDLSKTDEIGRNIFENETTYKNAYGFFSKRPLYPITAYILNFIYPNPWFDFLVPTFVAYLAVVVLVYLLSEKGLGKFFAFITAALFISFYPFLDWSTYFMTDTIGAFFWLFQLFSIYRFLQTEKTKWLTFFTISLAISLLNREQSVLIFPLVALAFVLAYIFKLSKTIKKGLKTLTVVSFFITLLYIVSSALLGQKNVLDTIAYTQNNYGLQSRVYSWQETLNYLISSVKVDHIIFAKELVQHHWWFLITLISIAGILKTFINRNKTSILSILIFASGVASYLSIFIYPVLSYRYFFPVLFTIIYFAVKFTKEYFEKA